MSSRRALPINADLQATAVLGRETEGATTTWYLAANAQLLQHLGPVLAPLGGARTTSVVVELHYEGGRPASSGASGGRGVGQAGPVGGDDEHDDLADGCASRWRPGQRRRRGAGGRRVARPARPGNLARCAPSSAAACPGPARSTRWGTASPPTRGRHARCSTTTRRTSTCPARRRASACGSARLPAHGRRCAPARRLVAPARRPDAHARGLRRAPGMTPPRSSRRPAAPRPRARPAQRPRPDDAGVRCCTRRPQSWTANPVGALDPAPDRRNVPLPWTPARAASRTGGGSARRGARPRWRRCAARPPGRPLRSAGPCAIPSDDLTPAERARLAPHFTNLDGPVFALVNLPETVKGALFARYSRYPGTLRRLFLDEFAGLAAASAGGWDAARRASGRRELYERIFLGYGDDSVAQLGGAHVACEWVSNVLTKILQRPRLAAYLEQSTRYIAYDAPMPGGGYRYYRDAGSARVRGGDGRAVRHLRGRAAARARRGSRSTFPRAEGESEAAHAARDQGQGARPAARPAAGGVAVAHGHLRHRPGLRAADPAPARATRCRRRASYGEMILDEVKAVMPSFVARVERPERGGEWIDYLERARARPRALGRAPGARPRRRTPRRGPSVRLLRRRRRRGAPARGAALRGRRARPRRRRAPPSRGLRRRRARRAARRARRRAREPPPPPRPRLRGAALPLRDRLGLRRLPRPPAPPHADRAVAAADARTSAPTCPRRSTPPAAATPTARARALARRVRAPRRRRGCAEPRPTRSASATGSATCSTSTPARRCT